MRPYLRMIMLAAAIMIAVVCSKRVMVPPAIDLEDFETLGILTFEANAKGSIAGLTTRKFLEAITRDQKGIAIIELGEIDEVLKAVGKKKLDLDAIKAIGEKYQIKTLITGNLDISDVKPEFDIGLPFPSVSITALVEANLTSRLVLTGNGATVWTGSDREKRKIGSITVLGGGLFGFDAKDPESAYGSLVEALVYESTYDFRVSWR